MSGADTADRIPLLPELILPVTEFGYAWAAALAVACFVLAVVLVWVPVKHVVLRGLRDLVAQTALISFCWAALSIAFAYAWEISQ
ncbi:hypothetical protein F7Q99_38250 [Streptomyces kaniharaensis]|uniref:Uncharacterized protein n=1 Tax=Streptomyces kaniharaensis TaxID=212423 RepID=A0A6N7L4P9_9ACTN|nr:hypothetical protein [Streptomyces kaniharaensis]MQS17877.1 hypothetical protein [Streptomyces kaniharaensis]